MTTCAGESSFSPVIQQGGQGLAAGQAGPPHTRFSPGTGTSFLGRQNGGADPAEGQAAGPTGAVLTPRLLACQAANALLRQCYRVFSACLSMFATGTGTQAKIPR